MMTWIGDSRFELVLGSLVTSLSNLFHSVQLNGKVRYQAEINPLNDRKKTNSIFLQHLDKK